MVFLPYPRHKQVGASVLGRRKQASIVPKSCDHKARAAIKYRRSTGSLKMRKFDIKFIFTGPRMVCAKCGTIGVDVRLNWRERTWQSRC